MVSKNQKKNKNKKQQNNAAGGPKKSQNNMKSVSAKSMAINQNNKKKSKLPLSPTIAMDAANKLKNNLKSVSGNNKNNKKETKLPPPPPIVMDPANKAKNNLKSVSGNNKNNKKKAKLPPPPPVPMDSESEDIEVSDIELEEDDDASSVDLNLDESTESKQPSLDDLLSSGDEEEDQEIEADKEVNDDDESETEDQDIDEEEQESEADDDDKSETEDQDIEEEEQEGETDDNESESEQVPAKDKNGAIKSLVRTPEEQEERNNATSVFVGNLPLNTDRHKLEKLFSKFGKILAIRLRLGHGGKFFKSPKTNKNGHSSLIAFVDFKNEADAKASCVLNGEKFYENVIRVDIQKNAKTKENYDAKRTIFVGNLGYTVSDNHLHEAFGCCGAIDYVRTMQSPRGCAGSAFVCFKDSASVENALKLNKTIIKGREARVGRYEPKVPERGALNKRISDLKYELHQLERRTLLKPNKNGKAPSNKKAGNGKKFEKVSGKGKKTEKRPGNDVNNKAENKPNFAGVKNDQKKKKNIKQQKGPKGQKALAKKIAPKA